MATIPADVSGCLQTFERTLERMEHQVAQLTQHITESAPEDPLQKAEAHAALARTITLLVEWYLRCEGINPAKHPVQNERKRVDLYVKKVRKAAAEQQLSRLRPATALNVAAANRFIEHAIPNLTPAQRQHLKEVSKQHQQQHTAAAPGGQRGRGDKRERPPPSEGRAAKRGGGQGGGSAKDAAVAFLREAAAEAATAAAAPPGGATAADSGGDSE